MLMPLAAERAMLASVSSSVSTHLIFGVVVRVSSVVFSRVFGCAGVFCVLFPAAYLDDDVKIVRDLPCDYVRKECQQGIFP